MVEPAAGTQDPQVSGQLSDLIDDFDPMATDGLGAEDGAAGEGDATKKATAEKLEEQAEGTEEGADDGKDGEAEGDEEGQEEGGDGDAEAEEDGDEEAEGEEGEAEGEEEGEEEGEGGEKAQKKAAEKPRTFRVKINNEERTVTEKELVRGFQKGVAADERFRKANDLFEEARFTVNRLAKDPMQSILDLYTNHFKGDVGRALKVLDEKVGEWMQPRVDELAMSEDEQRVRQKERALEYREKQLEKKNQKDADERQRRLEEREWEKIQAGTRSALKETGLPDKPLILKRMSLLMKEQLDQGLEVDPLEAAKQIVEERKQLSKEYASTLSKDELDKELPEASAELKKQNVEKVKAQRKKKTRSTKSGRKAKPQKRRASAEPDTPSNWFGNLYEEMQEAQ